MGEVKTTYVVDFGPANAEADKLATSLAAVDKASQDVAANTSGAFKGAAGAIAEYTQTIKDATEARNLEQAALKRVQGELAATLAAYKKLDNPGTRSSAAGDAAIRENQKQQRALRRELEEINKVLAQNNQQIDEAKNAIDREKQAQKQLAEATKAAAAEERKLAAETKAAAAEQNKLASAGQQTASATQATSTAGSFLNGVLGKVSGAFAAFFAFNKLKQIGHEIIDVTAEFERLEAVITTINGGDSERGKLEFANLRQFTLRNPFEVREVTEAYVQLRNRGINPTTQQLQSLADLAAASGKSFGQVAEGLLGATTGQYRRLKEFGVTAKQFKNEIEFTFRGQTERVEKSQEAIAAYVLKLGELNGVAGSTSRIMETTGGRITNLKDNFTELFNVIGEGTGGPVNFFIKRLTIAASKVTEFLKSTETKAADEIAKTGALDNYGAALDGIYSRIREQSKKSGADVTKALADVNAQMLANLEKQAAAAEANLTDLLNKKKAYDAIPMGAIVPKEQRQYADPGDKLEIEARRSVQLLKGEIAVLKDRTKAIAESGDEEGKLTGLIEKQKKVIEDLQERQKKAKLESRNTDQKDGGDFLFGKGGLNQQLKDAQAELDRLLGKTKQTASKLEAALKALREAELRLREKYNKELEANAKDNATKLAKIQYDHDLEEIARLKQTIIEKEKAVKKAGGKGVDADGRLNATQQAEINKLTVLAQQEYNRKLEAIERETNAKILELQAESDAKELAQLNAKFDEELRVAKLAGNKRLAEELELARKRQVQQLKLNQELRKIDEGQSVATSAAQLGRGAPQNEVVTGVERPDPASLTKFQQIQQLIADARIDTEKNLQKQLLEIQVNGDKQRLDALTKDGKKANDAQRIALAAAIQQGEDQLKKLDNKASFQDFLLNLLGVKDEDKDKVKKAFAEFASQTLGQLNDYVNEQVAITQQVADAAKQNVEEKRSDLDREIELNKLGFASNVETKRAELAEAKKIRQQALEDQKKAQQAQLAVETITQTVGLISSSVDIIKGFSKIPIIGLPLGIAAVAAMFTAFVAFKSKALSSAGQKFEQGGVIGGKRHSAGGAKFRSEDGQVIELEEGEHVTKRSATKKHRRLLDAINAEDENRMIQYLYQELLRGTGVVAPRPDPELPNRMQRAQASYTTAVAAASGHGSERALAALTGDVAAIRRQTQPRRQVIDTAEATITIEGNRTRIERKKA